MTDKRPMLCVVAGPNGSGKTTTTVQLLNDEWTADSLYIIQIILHKKLMATGILLKL